MVANYCSDAGSETSRSKTIIFTINAAEHEQLISYCTITVFIVIFIIVFTIMIIVTAEVARLHRHSISHVHRVTNRVADLRNARVFVVDNTLVQCNVVLFIYG